MERRAFGEPASRDTLVGQSRGLVPSSGSKQKPLASSTWGPGRRKGHPSLHSHVPAPAASSGYGMMQDGDGGLGLWRVPAGQGAHLRPRPWGKIEARGFRYLQGSGRRALVDTPETPRRL